MHTLQKPVTPHHRHSNSDLALKRPPKILLNDFPEGGDSIKAELFSPKHRLKSRRYTESSEIQPELQLSPQQKANHPHHNEFRIKSAVNSLRTSTQDLLSALEKQDDLNPNTNSYLMLKSPTIQSLETQDSYSKTSLKSSMFKQNRERILSDSSIKFAPSKPTSDESTTIVRKPKFSLPESKPVSNMEAQALNLKLNPCNSSTLPKVTPMTPDKSTGVVKAFGANTNNGIVRNYNEDKVSIILNIIKPASLDHEQWPKCSFFGVYDGHGGAACADFLRDNLYRFVLKEPSFPSNPREALRKGFQAAETKYLEISQSLPDSKLDRSGSCALVALIVGQHDAMFQFFIGDICYVANVGDSRAVMSGENGNKVYTLTKDHKPSEESEQKRIIAAGGTVYQTRIELPEGKSNLISQSINAPPLRVLPGRLSVSRTFGDAFAKVTKYGGNPNVVIAEPDIKAFKIQPNYDFIILATDGVFDKLSSREVIETVWKGINTENGSLNAHEKCAAGVENLLKEAMDRRSFDNVTAVLISFTDFVTYHHKNTIFHDIIREDAQLPTIESPGIKRRPSLKFNLVPSNEIPNSEKITAGSREDYLKPSPSLSPPKFNELKMDFSPKKTPTCFYTKPTLYSVKSKEHKRSGSLGS